MLKYKGRVGLWLLLVFSLVAPFGCGPMNQKPAIDPSQNKSMCDPQLPLGSSGATDPTGGEPVAFTDNKNYIVSISFVGVPGSDPAPSASSTPQPSPSPTSDNDYLLRIVSSPSLQPLSPTAQVVVQQVHIQSTTPNPQPYNVPVTRQDQWGWMATVHFGRPSTYEIHVTITDGGLPAEERVFHVSFN